MGTHILSKIRFKSKSQKRNMEQKYLYEENSRSMYICSVILALCIIVLLGAFATAYINVINKSITEYIYGTLEEVGNQSAFIVENKIKGDIETLESIAIGIESHDQFDEERALKVIREKDKKNKFKRMGIINLQGRALTTDGKNLDFSQREYFKKAVKGESNLSDILIDRVDGKNINVYAVPINYFNEVVAVIFATNETDVYKNVLNVSLFSGKGCSYVVENTGNIVVNAEDNKNFKNIQNVFQDLKPYFNAEHRANLEDMKANMAGGKRGVIEYSILNKERYMCYTPVVGKNWYILSVIPQSVLTDRAKHVLDLTLYLCIVIFSIFAVLFTYIVINDQKSKKRLAQIAYLDEVTKKGNWNMMVKDIRYIFNDNKDQTYAYVAFDIDKFKLINELYGYEEGDNILRFISNKLSEHMLDDERYARVNGDKFGIFMRYGDKETFIKRLISIYETIVEFKIENIVACKFTISAGIYIIENRDISIRTINDMANLARATVKYNHKSDYAFYNVEITDRIHIEKEITDTMEDALKNREFVVYLQPKYSLKTMEGVGAEALVRWKHPIKGLIAPMRFIPIFERNGFVKEVDLYVFEEVCKKLRQWIDEGHKPVRISVNLSRVHMLNTYIIDNLEKILRKYNISPSLVELELTESAVFDNIELLLNVIKGLKKAGFIISMDDFGTGYSSLNLLKDLPVDIIKLDREFLKVNNFSDKSKTVISDIISMAKHLNVEVICEGVETKEQVDFLVGARCDMVQGFYFAKPMPIEDYERLVFNKL